jgi:hypothetical protein
MHKIENEFCAFFVYFYYLTAATKYDIIVARAGSARTDLSSSNVAQKFFNFFVHFAN